MIEMQRAPLRICEVTVINGDVIEFTDALSGATAAVNAPEAAETMGTGMFVIARIADSMGETVFVDLYPYALGREPALAIVADVRERFPESEWNERDAGGFILRQWANAVVAK